MNPGLKINISVQLVYQSNSGLDQGLDWQSRSGF